MKVVSSKTNDTTVTNPAWSQRDKHDCHVCQEKCLNVILGEENHGVLSNVGYVPPLARTAGSGRTFTELSHQQSRLVRQTLCQGGELLALPYIHLQAECEATS